VTISAIMQTTWGVRWTGLAGGVSGGLVGLGGGTVMVPLLSHFGWSRHQAHATSFAAVIVTGSVGGAVYAWHGSVAWLHAAVLAGCAATAANLGARMLHRLDAARLRRAFGGFLIAMAVVLLARPFVLGLHLDPAATTAWIGVAITGLAAGFAGGLLGVGGGSIMIPGLVLLAALDQKTAQGTALIAMIPAAIAGTITNVRQGSVVGAALPNLVPGLILGSFLGGSIVVFCNEMTLRVLFAGFLIIMGWRDLRR
jgi:uncharacterized membrane protein YfcA